MQMTQLQKKVLQTAKMECPKVFTKDMLEPYAAQVGINLVSLGPALSILCSKHHCLKRSRGESGRTVYYRHPDAPCPEGHLDYGFNNIANHVPKTDTAPAGATINIPGLGELSIADARKAYEQLKEVFG